MSIGGEQNDPFDLRLSNQQPVEGIFVYDRQSSHCNSVFTKDREFTEIGIKQSLPELSRIYLKILVASPMLDRCLPDTHRAEIKLVNRIHK